MNRCISFSDLLSEIVFAEKIECHRQIWKDGSAWEGYYSTPRHVDGLSFICSCVEVTYDLPDGRKRFASQGDVVYVPRDSLYRISFENGGKGTDIYTINFILRDKDGKELRFGKEIEIYKTSVLNICCSIASQLADACLFAESNLKKQTLFFQILEIFSMSLENYSETYYPIRQGVSLFLAEWNLNEKMNRYAQACEMSESSFYAYFKAWSGKTPIDYRNEIRITAAKSMLTHTNFSIAQIAEKIGFEDPYYFSRVFKKSIGVSPREYRKWR